MDKITTKTIGHQVPISTEYRYIRVFLAFNVRQINHWSSKSVQTCKQAIRSIGGNFVQISQRKVGNITHRTNLLPKESGKFVLYKKKQVLYNVRVVKLSTVYGLYVK